MAHKGDMVDMGGPVGKTKQVTPKGITDVKNDIGAYGIVQAASHEEAAKMFMDSPHFFRSDATIEVCELPPIPGM